MSDGSNDLLATARTWLSRDGRVALATIVDTWGSAPVPVGGQMVIAGDTRFEGSVSGGCVEGEVITLAGEALEDGRTRLVPFGVEDQAAWRVGLPCGGRIQILIERLTGESDEKLLNAMIEARGKRRPMVIATDTNTGERHVWRDAAEAAGDDDIAPRFSSGRSSLETRGGRSVFVHTRLPPPRIVIIGATHIAQCLCELTRVAGYETLVVDPRTAFASPARFPHAEIVTEWPQDVLPRIGLDAYTGLATLAHVEHIDDEALLLATRAPCFYIGALGSRRNHARRVERLKAAGLSEAELARISAPIGLDIGATTPPEIAVSVMAEIVRHLRGARGKGAAV
ncbi:MAG: XdhC family protein [Hyphomicrobiales bacterium]|nr:XdhC family protein [Hyphomicrobiales bacterium]